MQEYVLGFLFDECRDYVALIRKTKPESQKGLLNGIGGKVEPGEAPHDAMVREFKEETGVDFADWSNFAKVRGPDGSMWVFCGASEQAHNTRTTTEEAVCVIPVVLLPEFLIMPNLTWLIPLALNSSDLESPVLVRYRT